MQPNAVKSSHLHMAPINPAAVELRIWHQLHLSTTKPNATQPIAALRQHSQPKSNAPILTTKPNDTLPSSHEPKAVMSSTIKLILPNQLLLKPVLQKSMLL